MEGEVERALAERRQVSGTGIGATILFLALGLVLVTFLLGDRTANFQRVQLQDRRPLLVVVIATTLLLLLTPPATAAAGTHKHVARQCDPRRDVRVNQTMGATQLDGTNVFDVVVTNAWRGPVRDVHLNCGYRFRPVRQVDPGMLVPVGPGDCLLIHGGAIGPGGNVSFSYFSYVEYTMDVVSATCAGRRP